MLQSELNEEYTINKDNEDEDKDKIPTSIIDSAENIQEERA